MANDTNDNDYKVPTMGVDLIHDHDESIYTIALVETKRDYVVALGYDPAENIWSQGIYFPKFQYYQVHECREHAFKAFTAQILAMLDRGYKIQNM